MKPHHRIVSVVFVLSLLASQALADQKHDRKLQPFRPMECGERDSVPRIVRRFVFSSIERQPSQIFGQRRSAPPSPLVLIERAQQRFGVVDAALGGGRARGDTRRGAAAERRQCR